MVDSVMGVRKPTFKRPYTPTRLNSNYLFHSISLIMVYIYSYNYVSTNTSYLFCCLFLLFLWFFPYQAYSDYSFEELRLFAPKIEK